MVKKLFLSAGALFLIVASACARVSVTVSDTTMTLSAAVAAVSDTAKATPVAAPSTAHGHDPSVNTLTGGFSIDVFRDCGLGRSIVRLLIAGLSGFLNRRLGRLRDDAQLLREYCLQVRELFQTEVEIRQNRIMKALTLVTTLCLPLSLVAGWYGMNFTGMPELGWKYGYPAVIVVSVLIVSLCLWIMKKKKFW